MQQERPDHESEETLRPEDTLRPTVSLEVVTGREFLSENVAISGRHFVRCSFNFCNLIYSGGPVGLVECGGSHNRLVEVGPLKEALEGHAPDAMREKMLRYWHEVRVGLNIEKEKSTDTQDQG